MGLSPSQIAQYAANAGFSGTALQNAVAIALAESGGNPSIIGDTNVTPGGSVGLWQINLAAHPEYSAADLLDPQANADAAFAVYQQSGGQFTPWTTFNTGAFAPFLPATPSTSMVLASDGLPDDDSDDDSGDSALGIDSNLLIVGGIVLVGLGLWWMDS